MSQLSPSSANALQPLGSTYPGAISKRQARASLPPPQPLEQNLSNHSNHQHYGQQAYQQQAQAAQNRFYRTATVQELPRKNQKAVEQYGEIRDREIRGALTTYIELDV